MEKVTEGVWVSNASTDEWEADPEVGGETHLMRRNAEGEPYYEAGLWRVLPGNVPEPAPFTFEEDESVYVLEGSVEIEIVGAAKIKLGPGDIASFAKGTTTTWRVEPPFKEFFVLT